jgi:TatD DNase family protein
MAPLDADVPGVLARARGAGVGTVVVPAYDLASWDAVRGLCARPGVRGAYGLHPWAAHEPLDADRLAEAVVSEGAVAIGEVGLDFAIDGADRVRQIEVLRAQLAVAAATDRPVILHCRRAFDELLDLLGGVTPRLRGVVHAFSRGPDLAARFLALGLHLGFGGVVTRSAGRRARRSAAMVPGDRLLLETDAPSIGLEGVPAERAEPRHVVAVGTALAALRGEPVAALAERTTANARSLFRLG